MAESLLTSRDRILALLAEEPGLHLREVPRRLGLSLRAVRYNLDRLADEHVVTSHRSGRFERWFPAKTFSVEDRALISALRVRSERVILGFLLMQKAAELAEIRKATSLSSATLARDLDRLIADRIVDTLQDQVYRLCDPEATRMRLALYRRKYPDLLADAAQEIFEETR